MAKIKRPSQAASGGGKETDGMSTDPGQRRANQERPLRSAGIDTPEPPSFVERLEAALTDAPIDDEPLTEEDLAAIEAGWEDYRQGRTITLEELLQRDRWPAR
jgi:hypothetical protein